VPAEPVATIVAVGVGEGVGVAECDGVPVGVGIGVAPDASGDGDCVTAPVAEPGAGPSSAPPPQAVSAESNVAVAKPSRRIGVIFTFRRA
jgi:hypothetical protein